jgi:hypothetical protein
LYSADDALAACGFLMNKVEPAHNHIVNLASMFLSGSNAQQGLVWRTWNGQKGDLAVVQSEAHL